jgi:hypothetical protein
MTLEYRVMLKIVWTSAAAAAPDADAYRGASDTLSASYGGNTATAQIPRAPPTGAPDIGALRDSVRAWLTSRTLPHAPAKLMMHGYDYDPRHAGDPAYDPFRTIYGYPGENWLDARLSWLPLVGECDAAGGRRQDTAIAFAWVSTGSLAEYATAGWSESYQYACVDLAPLAARAAAALLRLLAAEGVVVDVLAHSLGTRLFTKTVAALDGDVAMINNVVLLDGAEFALDAAATFAGRACNVVNVTNEVDAVLSTGAEQLGDPSRLAGSMPACSLGRYGLGKPDFWAGAVYPPNWVDIALDRRDIQDWFKANGGYALTPTASDNVHPSGNMNHWACYTEPGNRAWLTDLLWKPGMNGGAFARIAALPKGILRDPQPVFAGFAIPDTTPMTIAARIAYQRGGAVG